MSGLETHYSARDIEARILAGLRAAGLNPDRRLTPEERVGARHSEPLSLHASHSRIVGQRLLSKRHSDRTLMTGR